MPVINSNIGAVIAKNAIARNESQMTTAMERLSTGKRVNSAADDAAGLAIGSKFSNQIAGLNQAARNANDGISMVQTAEGAFVEIGDMLQRMRQLAVQAASETYTSADREALDLEFQALSNEVNSIISNTQWNAANLLDGTAGTEGSSDFRKVKVQSGANAAQTVAVDFGMVLGDAVDENGETAVSGSTGVLEDATDNGSFNAAITAATATAAMENVVTITNAGSIEEGDVLMFTIQANDNSSTYDVAIELSDDQATNIGGGTADELDDGEGGTIRVSGGKTLSDVVGKKSDDTTDIGIEVDVTGAGEVTIKADAFDADNASLGDFKIFDMRVVRGDLKDIQGVNVATQALAESAITALDSAQELVNSQRASLGSYISRFEHASRNLINTSQNMQASRSGIVDADYAAETTELARTQIIQQAATAMLAQANASKQFVLELVQ